VGLTSLIYVGIAYLDMGFLCEVIIALVAVLVNVVVVDPTVTALINVAVVDPTVVVSPFVDAICVHLNECYYHLFEEVFPYYQCSMAICFNPLGFDQFMFSRDSLVIDFFVRQFVLEYLWYEPKHQTSLDLSICSLLSDNLPSSSQISLGRLFFHLFRELSLHN